MMSNESIDIKYEIATSAGAIDVGNQGGEIPPLKDSSPDRWRFHRTREILIKKYIGVEVWRKYRNNPHIRLLLIKNAMKDLRQETIQRFGNMNNYYVFRAKQRGFKTRNELNNYNARIAGFENDVERKKQRIIERGFSGFTEYKKWLKKQKSSKANPPSSRKGD